jgi:16S rRNA (cytosine1402-N4)-methyltransferase
MTIPHVPVLAGEAIELLDPQPGQTVVDCTFGAGGHARLLAGRIGATGALIAIDRDPMAAERFAELAPELSCTSRFIRASFVDGLRQLHDEGVRADLVLMDLGMSSMQVDTWQRGFSYSYDAPLDMRMDPDLDLTAHELVNSAERRRLEAIFRELGEERYARQIARAIEREREREPRRSPRRRASPPAIRPSVSSRRCGSRSTTSWGSSTRRCRSRGRCWRFTGGSRRSRSTRSRTGG